MGATMTDQRKPLYQLSDEELTRLQADPAETFQARQMARTILVMRRNPPSATKHP